MSDKSKAGIFFLIFLIPAIKSAFPFWASATFQHQPLCLLGAFFLFLRQSSFPDLRISPRASGKKILLLFGTLTIALHIYRYELVFSFWLFIPISLIILKFIFTETQSSYKETLLFLIISSSMPAPFPIHQILLVILTESSIKLSYLIMLLAGKDISLSGETITYFSQSLAIAPACSGINGVYASTSLLFLFAIKLNLKAKRIIQLSIFIPLSIIFFNSLRIATLLIASKFIKIEKIINEFHTFGPVFFLPHILLFWRICKKIEQIDN